MNHKDWLAWRQKGIGSSDAPIICNISPYSTPRKLWETKLGLCEDGPSNWATRRGQALEPQARAHYEFITGREMPLVLIQHPQYSWLRASLDGFDGEHILEIKCLGRDSHELAVSGRIPDQYYPQVQHQMLVTGKDKVDYFSWHAEHGVIITVDRDDVFLSDYFERAVEFWVKVQTKKAPDLIEKDFKAVKKKELRLALEEWERAGKDPKLSENIFKDFKIESQRIRIAGFHLDGPTCTIT